MELSLDDIAVGILFVFYMCRRIVCKVECSGLWCRYL